MDGQQFCYKYPHSAVATDCVIFGEENNILKVLLVRRRKEPFKDAWALPGGFLEIDETARVGALRELLEETGVVPITFDQLHTYSELDRDPRERVISITYIGTAMIRDVVGEDDAAEARWWNLKHLPVLAFDHQKILNDALKKHFADEV